MVWVDRCGFGVPAADNLCGSRVLCDCTSTGRWTPANGVWQAMIELLSRARPAEAILRYGDGVATKKITITLPEGTLAALRAAAAGAGIPLSTYIAKVAEHHARIEDGRAAMREWEAVSGPVDPEVQAAVDREIDLLDAMVGGTTPADTHTRRRAG